MLGKFVPGKFSERARVAAALGLAALSMGGVMTQEAPLPDGYGDPPPAGSPVILITGSTDGLGREVALRMAATGAHVIIHGRNRERGAALVDEIRRDGRGSARFYAADFASLAQVRAFARAILRDYDRLDVLVNNAGIAGPTGKVDEINPEDWDRCVAVCLTGQFNCARLAVPYLRRSSNASIINIASVAGRLGFALRSPYAAAKWGVIGFTKSLSIELGEDRIRVNAILPGLVAGDRQRRVLEAKAQQRGLSFREMEERAFSFTSIKEYVTPQQIADQIVFLASPRGRTISGQAISICGDTQMLS